MSDKNSDTISSGGTTTSSSTLRGGATTVAGQGTVASTGAADSATETAAQPTVITAETAPAARPAPSTGEVRPHVLDDWFNEHFPENSGPVDKPIKYLTGEWHYVRDAYEHLKDEVDKYFTPKD